ncbi:MAG: DNA methyltransferase [Sulfolobales archaeon]
MTAQFFGGCEAFISEIKANRWWGIAGSRYREVLFRELVPLKSTTYATHGLYMYPARFIPHVIRYAIERYTEPGDWVFDPFAGYGTVAIEASLTGRNAVLWDLNPVTEVLTLASLYRWDISLGDFDLDWGYGREFHPMWENIFYWHPRDFYDALSRVWGYWHYEVYGRARGLEEVSKAYLIAIPLLKVTRFFSYSDEKIAKLYRSRYAEEKVKTLLHRDWRDKMVRMYWGYAGEVVEKVREYRSLQPRDIEIVIRTSRRVNNRLEVFDAIRARLDREVRLLITSPPYLQAQEYIRSFKLELVWLGYTGSDLRILAGHEIPYNNPPQTNIHSRLFHEIRKEIMKLGNGKLLQIYDAYFHSLAAFINNNHDKAEIMAIFVGPVKIRNMRIPIDEILREHLEALGFKHEETLIDRIVSRRLFKVEVNPATGLADERTPTEHLLIMRRK